MKTVELQRAPKDRRGTIHKNGIKLELHEERTAKYLTLYGFNIEVIKPVNTPRMNNPDILMDGTILEMKAPIRYNENTLKIRMKKHPSNLKG